MLREKGARFEEVDLSGGLSVGELDQLIGSRDYRMFLNSRNELYRERGMKDHPPPRPEALRLWPVAPPESTAACVRQMRWLPVNPR